MWTLSKEVFVQTRLPRASLPFTDEVTEQTTVKWSIKMTTRLGRLASNTVKQL